MTKFLFKYLKLCFSGKALVYKIILMSVCILHIVMNRYTGRETANILMDMFYWPGGITFNTVLEVVFLIGLLHCSMYDYHKGTQYIIESLQMDDRDEVD